MAVTDEQIQAAIARKQQATPQQSAQRGVTDEQIQAAIQRKQSRVGTEIAPSVPLTMEELSQQRLQQIEQVSRQDQTARSQRADQFLTGQINISDLGVFELLESVNRAGKIKDFGKRRQASAELKRQGITPEIINTFVELDDSKGFLASLKEPDVAIPSALSLVASGVTGAITKSPSAAAKAAAIGGGVGELTVEAFNRLLRPEKGRGPLQLSIDTTKTAATEGLSDLVGGKATGLALKGVKAIGRKAFIGKSAIEGAAEISEELRRLGKNIRPEDIPEFFGQRLPNIEAGLTPSQSGTSKFTAFVEGAVERAFGGSRLVQKKTIVTPVALKKLVNNNMDELMGDIARLNPTQIGALADDAFSGSQKTFKAIDSMNFERFKDIVNAGAGVSGKPQVNMRVNKKMASKLGKLVDDGKLLAGFDEDRAFIKNMARIAESTDIEQAITNNSNLNSMIRNLPKGSNSQRLAIQMQAELKKQMLKTARSVSDDAGKLGEEVYEFSREGREVFKSKMLELVAKDIADGTPHNAMTNIFEPEGLTRIQEAKDILLNRAGKNPLDIQKHTAAWDELRFGWLRDNVRGAETLEGLPILGDKLGKALKDMGPDALGVMFSPKELANINKTIKAMRLVQRGAEGGAGELVRFIQVGAAAGGRFGGKPGLIFAATGGPAILARVMANKNASGLLLSGKTGQFLALMARTKKEVDKKRRRIEKINIKQIQDKRAEREPTIQQQRGFGGRGF